MNHDLLRQVGARARAREAGARRIEESCVNGARAADHDRILSALDAQRSAELRAEAPCSARVRRFAVPTKGWVAATAATFAAAAAVVLAIRVGPASEAGPMDYTVSVTGRVEATRSAPAVPHTTLEARDDAMQEVVVRPREANHAKVVASVLVDRAGSRVPSGIAPEISELGAVRFDVPGPMLHGATALIVVLASPENGRDAAEIRIPVERGAEKN